MPQDIHNCASAYSITNSAGCVKRVCTRSSSAAFCPDSVVVGREDDSADVASQDGLKNFSATVDGGAKDRLSPVKFCAHARILRALAGKHEHDGRLIGNLLMRENSLCVTRVETSRALGGILNNNNTAVIEFAAAGLQCEGGVGQLRLRLFRAALPRQRFQICGQIRR